jgi:hypothetical protein
MAEPLATHDYTPGGLEAAQEFLKRTRAELRELRFVRLWKDRFQVIDVNKDVFEIRGIGYTDADVAPLLRMINAAYNPQTLHEPTEAEYKELGAGRRYTWAHDRVM